MPARSTIWPMMFHGNQEKKLNTENTSLTVVERVQTALTSAKVEAEFRALAEASKSITAITNKASYDELHSARMRLVKARTITTKHGKYVREDAAAFAKGTIAEVNRLLAIIEPEETRLTVIQTEHDTRLKREEEAKAAQEAARIELFQRCMAEIIAKPGTMIGKTSSAIVIVLQDLRAHDVRAWALDAAQYDQAESAKATAVNALEQLHASTLAQEAATKAESDRIAAEREELAKLRAEQAERERRERELIEEGLRRRMAEEAAAREKIEADQRASRLLIESDQRAARARQEEADRAARAAREAEEAQAKAVRDAEEAIRKSALDAAEAALRVEREKLERERAAKEALERAEREKAEAKARAKREAEEAKAREAERKRAFAADTEEMIVMLRRRITDSKPHIVIASAIDAYLAAAKERAAA